jgi:hypothetical protein
MRHTRDTSLKRKRIAERTVSLSSGKSPTTTFGMKMTSTKDLIYEVTELNKRIKPVKEGKTMTFEKWEELNRERLGSDYSCMAEEPTQTYLEWARDMWLYSQLPI